MLNFATHKDCKECPLWESATHPGIPTRPFIVGFPHNKPTAVLIVGEAPGYYEDEAFVSWTGHSGKILTRFIEASGIDKKADIYLSNACRCRPPQNSDPTTGNINKCCIHLQADLDLLVEHYKEVVIFCCGRYGTEAVTKQTKLSGCFSKQGLSLSYFNGLRKGGLTPPQGTSPLVFFTYHPAILLPSRQPGKVTAVADHFSLLLRYLEGDFIPNNIEVIPRFGEIIPEKLPPVVCVDIETYGILKGTHQSVFHPIKSQYVDNIPLGNQIISVAFGYVSESSPTGYETYVYDFKKHKASIHQWFHQFIRYGTTLIGQNIKFDISYLKMNDKVLNQLLTPRYLQLDDTLLVSFLLYEQRPEKGLKELATLFGLTDYNSLAVTGKSGTAKNAADPELHYYNCLDVATTLALYYLSWSQIEKQYGKDSTKLGKVCKDLRNIILWDTIMLEQNGCAMGKSKIRAIHKEHLGYCTEAIKKAKDFDIILAGKGSEASCRGFIKDALVGLNLLEDPRVQLTKKRKEISVGKDNFNLLLTEVTEDSHCWAPLQALKDYHVSKKMISSYTGKLLYDPAKGFAQGNLIFPSWYPMPAVAAKYTNDTTTGGTIQGRFACKNPAAQTFPPEVKKCITSRFPIGVVNGYDMSQIELRVAALLSGDPVMIKEYEEGVDRHAQTAFVIWPDASLNDPDWLQKRFAGKTLNFLVLYKGGALKYQETLMKDMGFHLSLAECQAGIDHFNRRYPRFRQWQNENIEIVRRQGYLELFTGWSRYWGKGSAANNFVSEIADFPIQTISAQFLQSAHFEIEKWLLRQRLRTKIVLQIHDALYLDGPIEEEAEMDYVMEKYLTHPPLFDTICSSLGRSIPILFEKERLTCNQ